MDYKYYENKINDIIIKCPIEAGVEILVYNVLDNIIERKGLALVDINRLWKDRDERLTTDGGVSDIAVLSKDFRYRTNEGQVYGFIEVKATNNSLYETPQIEGQKSKYSHYIYTNGLVWKYYKDGKLTWEVVLAHFKNEECREMNEFQLISINETSFTILMDKLNDIKWN